MAPALWPEFMQVGLMVVITLLSITVYDPPRPCHATCSVLFGMMMMLPTSDEIFCVLFLVGEYKKNSTLLRLCYYHSLFLILASSLMIIAFMFFINFVYNGPVDIQEFHLLLTLIILIVNGFVQFYVSLLIRSELIKLTNAIDNTTNTSYMDVQYHIERRSNQQHFTNKIQESSGDYPENIYHTIRSDISNKGESHILHSKQLNEHIQRSSKEDSQTGFCAVTGKFYSPSEPHLPHHPNLQQLINHKKGTANNDSKSGYCTMTGNINGTGIQDTPTYDYCYAHVVNPKNW